MRQDSGSETMELELDLDYTDWHSVAFLGLLEYGKPNADGRDKTTYYIGALNLRVNF